MTTPQSPDETGEPRPDQAPAQHGSDDQPGAFTWIPPPVPQYPDVPAAAYPGGGYAVPGGFKSTRDLLPPDAAFAEWFNLEATNELLGLIGFTPTGYQENCRTSFALDGARLEIDEWPLMPPYLEIEADSPADVNRVASLLGYDETQLDQRETRPRCMPAMASTSPNITSFASTTSRGKSAEACRRAAADRNGAATHRPVRHGQSKRRPARRGQAQHRRRQDAR